MAEYDEEGYLEVHQEIRLVNGRRYMAPVTPK